MSKLKKHVVEKLLESKLEHKENKKWYQKARKFLDGTAAKVGIVGAAAVYATLGWTYLAVDLSVLGIAAAKGLVLSAIGLGAAHFTSEHYDERAKQEDEKARNFDLLLSVPPEVLLLEEHEVEVTEDEE